ncbi:MAG: radical SAM protein [Candidatus Entotheonella factor]|uniref:Radical SAM protein n=1 Tax=Entotheonella factor TaxID=1429438 RepID=W4LC61_ENTF1|nr:CUAEP/CCAEP-tail radical SAM protein [Candidatus Entotheonella palauensis]ETW95514.1 MAG: radical SAM protein [Candidatus Entotheonella factor]
MRAVLISTYELGRQPFGLASPAAWLRQAGVTVDCQDLSQGRLYEPDIVDADLVAFYVPMHTATRIAVHVLARVQTLNPRAHICFYGLYAAMNADYLKQLGAHTILSGEFETELLQLARQLQAESVATSSLPIVSVSLERQQFQVPDREGLPPLSSYAHLITAPEEQRVVGYTEASRGCKHVCRHCPIVPVYEGRFRIVQHDVVLEDIRQQVDAGAEHITFGDPDFFNGIGHAIPLVNALHQAFPQLTYDVTIKIEHLLRYAEHLPTLRDTGCVLITSAVEAVQDHVLAILDKGHTRREFLQALALCRQTGLHLNPTFVAFMPWTTLDDYIELLTVIAEQGLIDHVAPIQLAMRLLIPAGSKILDVPEIDEVLDGFDEAALTYRWAHSDPRVDRLCDEALSLVQSGEAEGASRHEIFMRLWSAAHKMAERPVAPLPMPIAAPARGPVPYLSEPWYC